MARAATVARVHAAVLDLARRAGPAALTMEGIAAEAGVGKQTLYRNWPSVHALLFDTLASSEAAPDASAAPPSIEDLLRAAIDEIITEPHCSLLRFLAASIQTDVDVAREFQERLLAPQVAQVRAIVSAAGAKEPARATEMLLSPIFYRWFTRLPQFEEEELKEHVRSVMARDD